GKEKWSGASSVFYPDGRAMPPEAIPMAGQTERYGEELIICRPDGSSRNVLAFPKSLLAPNGELIGVYNTLVDITEYKQYEEKQAVLSEIVQSSDDAIVSKNLD